MKWQNIRLIFAREFRDQLRDRRTLFTIAVLPLLLYPLLGLTMLQVAQFFGEHRSQILIVGGDQLPATPPLFENQRFSPELFESSDPRLMEVLTAPPDEEADLALGSASQNPPEPAGTAAPTQGIQNSPNTQDATAASPSGGPSLTPEAIRRWATERIQRGQADAVVYFPPGFGPQLAMFRQRLSAATDPRTLPDQLNSVPPPWVITNEARDRSRIAGMRVETVLRNWRERLVARSLEEIRLPAEATRPFQLEFQDVAPAEAKRAAMWSKILPFVVLIWSLTGAFYPAIDLCAGEKERGTLETLLCSPALRAEIVWGKLLTVMAFSMATAILNLLSMGMTGTFVIRRMEILGAAAGSADIGPPPFAAMGWLLLALIPIAAFFSALSLAIAAFARSSKEGQYYLMPLLIITLPLMMLSVLPAAELNLGTSLIPVTGMLLLLQALVEGRYGDALPYVLPVVGVTGLCCLLAIRWAVAQFKNEAVLFRENERWGLAIWLRHVVRDRTALPSFGEAMLCGVILLVIGFFATFMAPPTLDWRTIAVTTTILQIALIATPALLMTIMLTRSPRQTLLLRTGQPWAAPAAVLLAVCLHPLVGLLGQLVQWLYPLSQEMFDALRPVELAIQQAPLWQVLLVVALLPAVCEELAYRGFILSGLRQGGHKWTAILVSSLFFGLAHGILQQKMTTCILGVVLGYVAVQSGSLLPSVLFHLANNGLAVMFSRVQQVSLEQYPPLGWLLERAEGGEVHYQTPVVLLAALVAVGLLVWFYRLTPPEQSAETPDWIPAREDSTRQRAASVDQEPESSVAATVEPRGLEDQAAAEPQ